MATMLGCPSCGKTVPRDSVVCPYCTRAMSDRPAPAAAKPPRWGRIMLVVGGLLVVGIWMLFSESGPRADYLAFDRQREEWHRKCDRYRETTRVDPEYEAALDCKAEMEELTAYAERKGWK